MPNKQYMQFLSQFPVLTDIPRCSPRYTDPVYIAVPFYHQDKEIQKARVETAYRVEQEFKRLGYNTICPIASIFTDEGYAIVEPDEKTWYDKDLDEMKKCSWMVIIDLPGLDTTVGVALEVGYAIASNMLVELLSPIWTHHFTSHDTQRALYGTTTYTSITSESKRH